MFLLTATETNSAFGQAICNERVNTPVEVATKTISGSFICDATLTIPAVTNLCLSPNGTKNAFGF